VSRCGRDAPEDWPKLLERTEAVFGSYKTCGLDSTVWRSTVGNTQALDLGGIGARVGIKARRT
jgi:hypothetical protein